MKYISRILALLLLIALPLGVFAQQRDKNVVLPAGQTVNGTYFGTGGDVRIDGTVNGDAYLAGGTVTVNGRINGDLLVAGGTVNIRGPVTQDIRVAGGTITISGDVGRNITVGGGTVIIEPDADIKGSVVAGTGTLSVRGSIGRDLIVGAGTASIENAVGGNVHMDAGNITVTSSAKIAGNLSYISTNDALIEKGASVSGKLDHRTPSPRQDEQRSRRNAVTGFLWGKIISLAAMYIIGLLFLHFLPRFTAQVVSIVKRDSWKSIGLGIVVLLVTPLVVIFLMATLIGIPFALALLFGYVMTLYIGKIFVAMFLGQWTTGKLGRKASPAWTLFVGLVLHMIITLIPVLGWIAGVFIMLWGVGALILGKKDAYNVLRKKDLL